MKHLLPDILALTPQLSEWRRHFHQNPEPSLKEYETAATIQSILNKLDISFETIGETGTLAKIIGTQVDANETQRQRSLLLRLNSRNS